MQHRSRSMRKTALSAAAMVAAGALALTGCAGDDSGDGELDTLTVVAYLPLESFTFTPEMVATAAGLFEEHGVNVELQSVQGTAAAIQSVIGGGGDITRAATLDTMPALEQGQPLVSIGAMEYSTTLRMVSSENNPIEEPADLEGAIVGLGSMGGTSEKTLDLVLNAHGIPAESVERQAVAVTGATYELVKSGQLSCYIVSLDTAIGLEQQNPDAIVSTAGMEEFSGLQTWLVSEETAADEAKAASVTNYLAAIRDAVKMVQEDAPNDYANILQLIRDNGQFDFPALHDDAIAKQALDIYLDGSWVSANGDILVNDDEAWAAAYENYATTGLVQGGADPSEWTTDDLLPAE